MSTNPPTRLSAEELQAIRERTEKATAGPWKVYKTRYTLTELGRRQGFKEDRKSVVNAIGTEWDHPQLKGPDAIVTTTHGPFYEPQHAVSIDDNDAEFIAHARTDIPALLAHISVLEAELQEARAVRCPAILMHGLAANLIHRIMSVEVQCNPPTDVDLRLASIIAELQEAREQNKRVENWRNNLFDYLMSEDAVVKKATNNFRAQLVAAVRNCDWHVDDNVMKLIQSFNPAPDKGE